MRKAKFKCPPYFETIKVVVCKDFEKAAKKLKLEYQDGINDFESIVFTPKGNKSILLLIRKKASAGVIAHEAVHIANFIFKRIHAELDINNDEPYAYLMGWIVDGITRIVKSK